MSDLVEEFLAREKNELAGLEDDIPSAFNGKKFKILKMKILMSSENYKQGLLIHAGDDNSIENSYSSSNLFQQGIITFMLNFQSEILKFKNFPINTSVTSQMKILPLLNIKIN